jgi:hypothetical protein
MKKQIDDFINTHKYAITMTAVAAVSLFMLRQQSKNVVMMKPDDDIYRYVKLN